MAALDDPRLKQRIRLTALLLGLLALGFYAGFIAMTVWGN
jgi:hypothetical protein